ncbi:MAG: regulatory protein RecX [Sedimentisphaerales bacterium]
MSRITALKTSKHTEKKVNMFLDGKFAISVDTEVVVKKGLTIGQELSDDQIKGLAEDVSLARCLNTAYRFLSHRPRSEAEMKDRLHRHGFENSQIEIVINKLKEQNLLDDTVFAQFWKENRQMFRPRSQRLTRVELKKKGVADEIIDEVTEKLDDMESAYQAALSKAQHLPKQEYEVFRRRLGDYLKRRGFGYAVINQTVKRIWQELKEQNDINE